eukprot:6579393-Pyramimonas_sp.AAC.1
MASTRPRAAETFTYVSAESSSQRETGRPWTGGGWHCRYDGQLDKWAIGIELIAQWIAVR